MFDFVIGAKGKHDDSIKAISALENKYGMVFPEVLKDYYGKYDGEKIKLTVLNVDGYECEVAKIVPIIADKMGFEKISDGDKEDGFLPKTYYPVARDRGGNYYYWDSDSYKVYLVLVDDYEAPFEVASSLEDFFEKMDRAN